jgi:hypothetical protein
MMNDKLIKISAQFHRYIRPAGSVEILEERYADPRKPNLCKLWVINGKHEFKQRGHANTYMIMLADRVGGDQELTEEAYKAAWNKVIPTYSEEARAAAILG